MRPDLCICFAGRVGRAYVAIQKLYNTFSNSFNLEEILSYLLKEHNEGGNDPDFIVAALAPKASLYRIKNGVIENDLKVCWIGNHDAFSTFQRYVSQMPAIEMVKFFATQNSLRSLFDC